MSTEESRRRYQELHWGRESRRLLDVLRPEGAPEHHTEIGRVVEVYLVRRFLPPRGAKIHLTEGSDGDLWLLSRDGVFWPDHAQGNLARIVYETKKGDLDAWFDHAFEAPWPRLAANRDGHAIIARGDSRYHITARGIEG